MTVMLRHTFRRNQVTQVQSNNMFLWYSILKQVSLIALPNINVQYYVSTFYS